MHSPTTLFSMRSNRTLVLLILVGLLATGATASAQGQGIRRSPRAYLTLSDGIGVNSGNGISSGSLWQLFRGSGVFAITPNHGIEITALRAQELAAAQQRFNDRASSVKGDGLFLSYARFDPRRGGGFPGTLSVGGGVMRRPSLDVGGPDRETWGALIGFENNVLTPRVSWADFALGARILAMPAAVKRQTVLITLTFGMRIG